MRETIEPIIEDDVHDTALIYDVIPKERMRLAIEAVQASGVMDNVDPSELVEIATESKVRLKDMQKLAGIVSYVKYRSVEKLSRVVSFERAFPNRSYNEEGEIARKCKETKAKRLEDSRLYKRIVASLHASMYVAYAIDRMKVLDEALEKIFSDRVADRDKTAYMKLFLEETRKPQELKLAETIDINEGSTKSIEDKLNDIALKLEGKSATEILSLMAPEARR